MKKLTILVDMDDVLENLVECWVDELNKKCGSSLCEEDITDWRIAKFFPSLTNEDLFSHLNTAEFWGKIAPMQNAQDILKKLIDDGHTIRIVTASHYATVPAKIKRLLEMYPYLKWEDVIVASDKSLIFGDIMIDDGTHNLEVTSCGLAVLFDRPHNRSYNDEAAGMVRVETWDEIYEVVSEFADMLSDEDEIDQVLKGVDVESA